LKIFGANWCQLTDWRQLPNKGCPYISTPNGAIYLTLAEHLHGLWPIAKAFEEYFRTIATFTEHSAHLHEATMVHYKVIYIYMV
jgi:hypothetical protein